MRLIIHGAYNPSIPDAKAKRSQVPGKPGLSVASLGYKEEKDVGRRKKEKVKKKIVKLQKEGC